MCALMFSTAFVWNISLSKKKWTRYGHKCKLFHVKYRLILSDFDEILIFSKDFRKTLKYKISWKSVMWKPSCSTRSGGRTVRQANMTKLMVAFRNFANAPKKLPPNHVAYNQWRTRSTLAQRQRFTRINLLKNKAHECLYLSEQYESVTNFTRLSFLAPGASNHNGRP